MDFHSQDTYLFSSSFYSLETHFPGFIITAQKTKFSIKDFFIFCALYVC